MPRRAPMQQDRQEEDQLRDDVRERGRRQTPVVQDKRGRPESQPQVVQDRRDFRRLVPFEFRLGSYLMFKETHFSCVEL